MPNCQTGLEHTILIIPFAEDPHAIPDIKQLAACGFAAVFVGGFQLSSDQNLPMRIDDAFPIFAITDKTIPICACLAFVEECIEHEVHSIILADQTAHRDDILRFAQLHTSHSSEMLIAAYRQQKPQTVRLRILQLFLRFFAGIDPGELNGGIIVLPTHASKGLRISADSNLWILDVLLFAKERRISSHNIPIDSIPTTTPLKRGLPFLYLSRLLSLFVKFSLSSMASYLCDILLFGLMVHITKNSLPELYVYVSAAVARTVSALINYTVNRTVVFQGKQKNTLHRYVLLACIIYLMSAFFTDTAVRLSGLPEVPIKLVVDGILFLVNYHMQRAYIFDADE